MRAFIAIVVSTLVALAPAHAAHSGAVVGYIAAFKGLDRELAQPGLHQYTHLVLAFVNPAPAGTLTTTEGLACAPAGNGQMVSDAQLQALVESTHRSGAKILASLGGAVIPPCGGDWTQLLQPQQREAVIANLQQFVDRFSLDGLDVDLEGDLMKSIDAAGNYTPFVRELAQVLHARSKLLTAATGSSPGTMVPDASLQYFDLLNIMSYDQVGRTWGAPGGEHSTYLQAQSDLSTWIGKGVPAEKLTLGLPFYGRGFGTYREGWSLQDVATTFGKRQLKTDFVGQLCGGCSYITYNGLPTLERKAELAGAWGAGVMVWEIGQDLADGRAIHTVVRGYRRGERYQKRLEAKATR